MGSVQQPSDVVTSDHRQPPSPCHHLHWPSRGGGRLRDLQSSCLQPSLRLRTRRRRRVLVTARSWTTFTSWLGSSGTVLSACGRSQVNINWRPGSTSPRLSTLHQSSLSRSRERSRTLEPILHRKLQIRREHSVER